MEGVGIVNPDTITIVSGLPRSGTSMMMKMLQAGGIAVLTDKIRTADEDNPKGYYEFERVKKLSHDQAWLEDAGGKAVKVISALLDKLPAHHTYKVIFMRRKMPEILASQQQMLIRREEPTDRISDQKMSEAFQKHLQVIQGWLEKQPNIEVLYVDYHQVLQAPTRLAAKVNQFLGGTLDTEAMAGAVDRTLYRQRQ
jgi:hypothetical protein